MIRTLAAALATSTCIVALATPAAAQTREYDIPAGSLKSALDAYVRQSGRQIVYRADQVRPARSPGARGRQSAEAALAAILSGSGFTTRVDGNLVAIVREGNDRADAEAGSPTDELVVTGTRIRGADTPSPVVRIDAGRIREEGFTDLGEVIRSVPQNFRGGQNPGVTSGNISGAGIANQNLTGGSSLNLRGLGPSATLTLLNGKRLAYGGFVQAVDIGTIPVDAVDRIEIVADGSSALYGSDAVGGVANVILRQDYEGVKAGGRYGGAADGGLETVEYSVTAGHRWNGGGVIAAYRNVSADPIYARQRDYSNYIADPATLYTGSDLQTGLISAHQAIGSRVRLRVDALISERDQLYYYNIYGATSQVDSTSTAWLIAPSVEVALPHDWTLSLGGSWGQSEHDQYEISRYPGGVSEVLSDDCLCNDLSAYEIGAEGPLFALPGGDARLSIGAGHRKVGFDWTYMPTQFAYAKGEERASFAYAEMFLPLIGPDQAIPGVRRLAASFALRGEDYSSFGGVSTPKLGVIYAPDADITLSASWGKSFKAPTLFERYSAANAYLYAPVIAGGAGYPADATVLFLMGGNADLQPERAETWNANLKLRPATVPRLEAEVTYFNIDYTSRVIQPIPVSSQALSNPAYSDFVDIDPTDQTLSQVIARANGFYNFSGVDYDPANVVALIYSRFVNVAQQNIRGIDLSLAYAFDVGPGRLAVRGAATWLDSKQRTTPSQPIFELSGTLYQPADLNARAGLVWTQGGLTASLFGNYTDSVTDTVRGQDTGSFTTFDAAVRYAPGGEHGPLAGLEITLSAQNIFNRPPPLYTPDLDTAAPYDSTNYSPIGRFVSLSISKRFGAGK